MATIDLNELRKEIEVDRKNLADKEAVLRYLESKETNIALPPKAGTAAPLADGVIHLDQLIAPESGRRTLLNEVEDVVLRFGDQEFTVAHVDAVFQQQGIKAKGEVIPRSRISTVLGKLEENGLLELTLKGGGSVAHRYKLKSGGHV